MKRIILSLLLAVCLALSPVVGSLDLTSTAQAKTAYHRTALTGGTASALDGIDGATLADGDFAFVMASNVLYSYILDDDSGAAESSPGVIAPDSNAGTKRWILQYSYGYFNPAAPGAIGETTPGVVYSKMGPLTIAASATMTTIHVSGAQIDNYGQTDNVDITFLAGVIGQSFVFEAATTVAKRVRFIPYGTEHIWLDGVDAGAGKYVEFASIAEGDRIIFHCVRGADGNPKWRADVQSGTAVAEE